MTMGAAASASLRGPCRCSGVPPFPHVHCSLHAMACDRRTATFNDVPPIDARAFPTITVREQAMRIVSVMIITWVMPASQRLP